LDKHTDATLASLLHAELAEVEAAIGRLRADPQRTTYKLKQAVCERERLRRHCQTATGGGDPLDRI
jgi:hypothetical protein